MAVTLQGENPQKTGTPFECAYYVAKCNQKGGLKRIHLSWEIYLRVSPSEMKKLGPSERARVSKDRWFTWFSNATTEGGFRAAITRKLRKLGRNHLTTIVTVRAIQNRFQYKQAKPNQPDPDDGLVDEERS